MHIQGQGLGRVVWRGGVVGDAGVDATPEGDHAGDHHRVDWLVVVRFIPHDKPAILILVAGVERNK